MVFEIGKHIQQQAAKIAEYAADPDHWYKVGEVDWIPGDLAEYVLISGDTRAVFTWTHIFGSLIRHMTVSVSTPKKYPTPEVVWTLAHYFGFTGAKPEDQFQLVKEPAPDWNVGINENEGCIVVQQQIR
jgi:hypothetical protein